MIIYPAVDLRNGKCVRLYQGDYNRQTTYDIDPSTMLNTYIDEGASWIHLVDLDGAINPNNNQSQLIAELTQKCSANIQIGGGLRSKDQIFKLLELGASRVVIGSLAVENAQEVSDWLKYFGSERIALALDISYNDFNQPMVVVNAWQKISRYSLTELLNYYDRDELKHVLCTNIANDGTLTGPDFTLYANIIEQFPSLILQASGGIQSLTDVSLLKEMNVHGAIIGRALYEKRFTLKEALSC